MKPETTTKIQPILPSVLPMPHVEMPLPENTGVFDTYHRPLSDLRISVTDRCNFRCSYCMPSKVFNQHYPFLARSDILTFEEITRIVRILLPMGLNKIRITGGEPLLRQDLPKLIQKLHALPLPKSSKALDITLTTNGTLLEKQLPSLLDSGLKRITISLDAIDNKVFQRMNDVTYPVTRVLQAIDTALQSGIDVKVNMVVIGGINDAQLLPMANYFRQLKYDRKRTVLRFIEFMDVGASNQWQRDQVITAKNMLDTISAVHPLEKIPAQYRGEVASRYRYQDDGGEIGIIASVTQPFCRECSRLRLSANGHLFTCLFANHGYNIRALLQATPNDDTMLQQSLLTLWKQRDDRYSEMRHQQMENPLLTTSTDQSRQSRHSRQGRVEMSYIGG